MKKQGVKQMVAKNYAQVELKSKNRNISSNSGLAWIDKSLEFSGFWEDIKKVSGEKNSNNEILAALKIRSEILSRISGATAIEDIEVLRKDKGFEKMTGKKITSPDTIINFIADKKTEALLRDTNKKLILNSLKASGLTEYTYDNDATYFESLKDSAEYSYRERKDFSGLLGFIPELNLCVTMDFRAGNVSPRDGILKQIKEIHSMCNKRNKELKRIRLDSAGHSSKIFKFCNDNHIDFYITLTKNSATKENIANLKEKEWVKVNKSYKDNRIRESAEIIYASNDEKCEAIRAIVLRWKSKDQLELFGDGYSYHVIGTNNIEQSAEEIIKIHAERMGSENYNKELKEGYNIEWMPSNDFTKNANYFYLGIIAFNCVEFVKRFFIGEEVVTYRIKKFRHWFVKTCGKLVKSGRRYIFQIINATDRTFDMFIKTRRRMQYTW